MSAALLAEVEAAIRAEKPPVGTAQYVEGWIDGNRRAWVVVAALAAAPGNTEHIGNHIYSRENVA